MAQAQGLLPDDVEDISGEMAAMEADGGQASRKGLIGRLWYYHPLILLGLSLVVALVAFLMRPRPEVVKPPGVQELYRLGRASLSQAMDVDRSLGPGGVEDAVRSAYADFKVMFRHWRRQLPRHPEFVNPYLLMGEAARRYARFLPGKRRQLREEAVFAYERALAWERRKWDDPRPYIRANFGSRGLLPIAGELRVRRQRRDRFLRYWRAVLLLELGHADTALREMQRLHREFRRQAMRETASGRRGESGAEAGYGHDGFLPRHFELLAEDRGRLHYYMARAYDALGQVDAAAREYGQFLLDAPRSRERFLASLWLAGNYMTRARKLLGSPTGGDAVRGEAMRLLRLAADKYEQVVQASAPEELLREAYFRGGRAFLAMAKNIAVGRRTWWDVFTGVGRDAVGMLNDFAGRELPERTRWLPVLLGRQMQVGALVVPTPLGLWTLAPGGALLRQAATPRKTKRERRDEYLTRAEEFFDGARGGARGRYDAASRVMIANVLLARGRLEQARRLFLHTMSKYSAAEVQVACRWGVARAFLQEGKLDRARVRLIGGVENEADSLLRDGEIPNAAWVRICRLLAQAVRERAAAAGARRSGTPPETPARAGGGGETAAVMAACLRIWERLPAEVKSLVSGVEHAGRIDAERAARLLVAVNELLRRRDLCAERECRGLRVSELLPLLALRDRSAMLQSEIEWLNRMYLEAVFPQAFSRFIGGKRFSPLPPRGALPQGMLVDAEGLERDLRRLAHAYLRRADELDRQLAGGRGGVSAVGVPLPPPALGRSQVARRRALEDAAAVNDFLLANYSPGRVDVMLENGEIFRRLAAVVADAPFRQAGLARDYVARSARAFYRLACIVPGTPREEAALWQAGRGFFRARQYGRAKETLLRYVQRYRDSDRAGIAQNLLGRSYFNLGQLEDAARVYADNAPRHSPSGNKALCYLGWTYLELGRSRGSDGKLHDRIGDPARPLAERIGRLARVETALQAFNEVRQLPGVRPESRAWRWATFGLGRTWYRIAVRGKRQASRAAAGAARSAPWVGWLRDHALVYLREAYNRYLLRGRGARGGLGIDPRTEPEDYGEVTCARFVTEYHMAMAQSELARVLDEPERAARAREHWARLIDDSIYPDVMFDPAVGPRLYLLVAAKQRGGGRGSAVQQDDAREPLLGVMEGPEYRPGYLRGLRRAAFFLLGQSHVTEGERLLAEYPRKALAAFRRAYAVYQMAHDRLPPPDAPQVIYLQGVCLQKIGMLPEAARKYALVVSAARNLKGLRSDSLGEGSPAYWASLARKRLADLENERP